MVFVSSVAAAAAAVDKINFVVWKLLAVVWAEERWRHSCLRATPAPAPTCTRSSTQRPLEEILLAASSSISVHPSFSSPSRNRKKNMTTQHLRASPASNQQQMPTGGFHISWHRIQGFLNDDMGWLVWKGSLMRYWDGTAGESPCASHEKFDRRSSETMALR